MDRHHTALAGDGARLESLETVRCGALLLGVVLHASMSFFPGPQVWLVEDQQDSLFLSVTFFLIHMLRMPTFFLIAGFVARLSLGKLGAGAFLGNRARRLGIPMLLAWPILYAATVLAAGLPLSFGSLTIAAFPLMHLWFLYLLLGYCGLFALAHLVGTQMPILRAVAQRAAPALLWPGAPLLLAAPAAAALYLHPWWVMWFGIPTPDVSFVPHRASAIAYGMAFGFGWLVQGRPEALPLLARRCFVHLALALACSVLCLWQTGLAPLLMPAPQGAPKLLFAAVYSLGGWCWALALVGLAQRFFHRPHAARRYLADASYWIYLVHLPLVVALQAMLAPLSWPWPIKFALILGVAFALMLGSYALLVRGTFIGAGLNGRKKPSFSIHY